MGRKKGLGNGSSRTWKCKFNCKTTKTPCQHLESLLPKEDDKSEFESKNKYAGRNVDRQQQPPADRAMEKARFIAKVSDGLMPIEVDILVLRYVYNENFATIADELKLLGTETVVRVHDEALTKLKIRLVNGK